MAPLEQIIQALDRPQLADGSLSRERMCQSAQLDRIAPYSS